MIREQKPSIGRIVHYTEGGKPLPALITEVDTDEVVSLNVFYPVGSDLKLGQIRFSKEAQEGCWSWPPRV